jgi:hypothetical protein
MCPVESRAEKVFYPTQQTAFALGREPIPQGLKRVCENSLVFLMVNEAKELHVTIQALQSGSGISTSA